MTTPHIASKLTHIVVSEGQIIQIQNWIDWKGMPWATTTIRLLPDGFFMEINDPELGGFAKITTSLDEGLKEPYTAILNAYQELFALSNPSSTDLERLGFVKHKIIEINLRELTENGESFERPRSTTSH